MTVYISIGNSDDKLPQAVWSEFYAEVNSAVHYHTSGIHNSANGTAVIHGIWTSVPTAAYQNACWCIEVDDDAAGLLGGELHAIAIAYKQQIAWAEAPETKFIG